MSSRVCKICGEAPARYCPSCAPHQTAPDLKAGARGDLQGLRGIEEAGQEIGALLDALMPPGWGFVLLAAQHGAAGYMTYVSSLDRSAIPTLLRESAVQLEQGADRPPGRLGREH